MRSTDLEAPPQVLIRAKCHPNIRITIRNNICGWIDERGSSLLWVNGPAAVGKSVIAKTISGFHDEIVATFFFSTSSDKTATTLFPTLAWEMARNMPSTRKYVIASLRRSGSLQTSQIEEQFKLLIVEFTLSFMPRFSSLWVDYYFPCDYFSS